MRITLVRHGETDYNKQNRIQGRANIPLNDEGRRQTKKLKETTDQETFDICFSSPLIRTVETAMILVGDQTEIRIDERLLERDLGELEGKDRKDYDYIKYWDYNLNYGEKKVEKIQDIFKRTEDFIKYLEKYHKDKSILIVSHGATIRALHHILRKTDKNKDLCNFNIGNCYYEQIETK